MVNRDDLNETVQRVVAQLHGATVADLGACDGGTAKQLIGWLPDRPKRFVVVEPDPRNLAMIARAGMPDWVEVWPCAIGDHNGKTALHQSESDTERGPGGIWSVSSTIRTPKETKTLFPFIQYRHDVEVACWRFDDLCEMIGIQGFDFLWVDIEGSERDLIEHGATVLARTRYLFIEHWAAELYAGMWTRDELVQHLPGWDILGEWQYDMLLWNGAVAP